MKYRNFKGYLKIYFDIVLLLLLNFFLTHTICSNKNITFDKSLPFWSSYTNDVLNVLQ